MKFPTLSARHFRLAREGGWIVLGQMVTLAGALVLVRALTEYLSPQEYGELALALTAATLVNQVIMGGLSGGIARYLPIAIEKNQLRNYTSASIALIAVSTAAVIIVGAVAALALGYFGQTVWIAPIVVAFIWAMIVGWNSTLSGIQNAARQRSIVALHSAMDSWLKILLAVGAVLILGRSSTAVILAYCLSALVVVGSQLFFLRKTGLLSQSGGGPAEPTDWRRNIFAYSWPFSVFGLFTWAQQASDRWALQTFSSSSDVGLYAVVFQLGYAPISLALGMLTSLLAPILFAHAGDAINTERNAWVHSVTWKTTLLTLAVTAIFAALGHILHAEIFALLAGEAYGEASYLLPWMIVAGGVFSAAQVLALKLSSEMRPLDMAGPKIGTALLGVGFNWYGAHHYGLQGVAGGMVLFSLAYFLNMAFITLRRLGSAQ